MDSILDTVKKSLGVELAYTGFDEDIMLAANSEFSALTQLGVGPSTGFRISDNTAVWSDFLADAENLDMAKTCVFLKSKLLFDPPATSFGIEAIKDLIKEYEWRLQVAVDPDPTADS